LLTKGIWRRICRLQSRGGKIENPLKGHAGPIRARTRGSSYRSGSTRPSAPPILATECPRTRWSDPARPQPWKAHAEVIERNSNLDEHDRSPNLAPLWRLRFFQCRSPPAIPRRRAGSYVICTVSAASRRSSPPIRAARSPTRPTKRSMRRKPATRACSNTPCTPQRQPLASTAVLVAFASAGSNARGGIATPDSRVRAAIRRHTTTVGINYYFPALRLEDPR